MGLKLLRQSNKKLEDQGRLENVVVVVGGLVSSCLSRLLGRLHLSMADERAKAPSSAWLVWDAKFDSRLRYVDALWKCGLEVHIFHHLACTFSLTAICD